MKRFFPLAVSLLFLWSCGSEPGKSIPPQTLENHAYADHALDGMSLNSPHTLTVPKQRRVALFLGNPGSKMMLRIKQKGSADQVVEVAGNGVSRIEVETSGNQLTLEWGAGPLVLGKTYVYPTAEQETPSVLLLSIDTLRADVFNAEHMPQTYALFRRRGSIFTHAQTTAPWTLPAHVSLLTGTYPAVHGVRTPDLKLGREPEMLGEAFQDAGYLTAAFTEGNYVSGVFGFARGFHYFYEDAPNMMSADPSSVSRLADNLAALRSFLVAADHAPAFVFFHTYEVHCPYLPRGKAMDPGGLGDTAALLRMETEGDFDAEVTAKLRDLYLGEVAFADSLLAPVLSRLMDQGWVVALVSDHGEEFGEHGGLLHSDTLYEEVMAVPMAYYFPEQEPRERSERVSLIDVAPTLTAAAGLSPAGHFQGRNLLEPVPDRPLFAETFFLGPHIPAEDPRLTAVYRESYKLIQERNFERYQALLFDLEKDSEELTNLQEQNIETRDRLFQMIEAYLQGKGISAEGVGELSEEQIEVMRSLGYVK